MMNRRGFLNKFLKGAAAAVVVAPTLLLKPKDVPEVVALPVDEDALRFAKLERQARDDLTDFIHNIDPVDTPFLKASTGADAHEWLTDELTPKKVTHWTEIFRKDFTVAEGQRAVDPQAIEDEFKLEVERKAREISRNMQERVFFSDPTPHDDWIDHLSFSRASMEAACGKNPDYFPEGSRAHLTAFGAAALQRSAEMKPCGSSLALLSSS